MTGPIKINNFKMVNSAIHNIPTTATTNNFMMS